MTVILTWLVEKAGTLLGYAAYLLIEKFYGQISAYILLKIAQLKAEKQRDKDVDQAKTATTPDEAYDDETKIVNDEPHP